MTTNYYSRLDSALIRPGRIDYTQYIGPCTKLQMEAMFKSFYQDLEDFSRKEVENMAEKFAMDAFSRDGGDTSPAEVQGLLMRYKSRPDLALENVQSLRRNKQG